MRIATYQQLDNQVWVHAWPPNVQHIKLSPVAKVNQPCDGHVPLCSLVVHSSWCPLKVSRGTSSWPLSVTRYHLLYPPYKITPVPSFWIKAESSEVWTSTILPPGDTRIEPTLFHISHSLKHGHLVFRLNFYVFSYFWLHWVFIAACRLPLVGASGGFSLQWPVIIEHGLQALGLQYLWHMGSDVGSSRSRNRTSVPCIARWTLNHWTTRETLVSYLP